MSRLFSIFAILFVFASCGGGSETPTPPQPEDKITIPSDVTPPVFNAGGGTSTVRFTASGAWTAQVDATRAVDWCRVSPTSGGKGDVTLSVATDPNDTYDERNATITLQCGTATKTITVAQKQKDALTVTSSKIEIPAEGGTATIEVKANITFDYELGADCKDWVTYSGTRALATSRLEFKIAKNDDTAVREGTITIRSGQGSETVKIYQAGAAPVLVLTQKDYTVGSAGETITVELQSNVDYIVTMPDVSWVKESGTRAVSTHTLYYTISPNEDYDPRSAEIIFTNKDNNLTQKVTITQVQKNAIVIAKSEYDFGMDGGTLDFDVMTNVELTVAVSSDAQSWIKQVQPKDTRGLEKRSLYFTVSASAEPADRTGTITISGGGVMQTVKVNQKGMNEILDKERAALVAIYNALDGPNWTRNTNWCSDKPVQEWYGVYWNGSRVNGLMLDSNNLKGTLPAEIGDLVKLETLRLENNQLSGSIPAAIGNLVDLQSLCMDTNQLSGSIPTEIGDLVNLQDLYLEVNKLSGSIPSSIGNLTRLKVLALTVNELSGSIPSSIGNLTDLEILALSTNKLSGSIPSSIGNLTKLLSLYLSYTEISGSIPSTIKNLTNLIELELMHNRLSGTVPQEVSRMDVWKRSGVGVVVSNPDIDVESAEAYVPSFAYYDMEGNYVDSAVKFPANNYTALHYWGTKDSFNQAFITDLVAIHNKFKTKGFDIIGFCDTYDTTFSAARKITQDKGMAWSNIFGLHNFPFIGFSSLPSTLVVDNTGLLKWHGVGSTVGASLDAFLTGKLDDGIEPADYESKDYSADGKVTTLQTATVGNGIDIILMGDAYSDRLIANGTYMKTMRKAMDYFFTEEPYKTFRNMFNVYAVTAVSKHEVYGTGRSTAFSGFFGSGTQVGGDDAKCKTYAKKVPGINDININNAQIVVMMNRKYYAGTCYMYYTLSGTADWGQGVSISYFPYLDDAGFESILHHEAGGHGFPKLADEYAYESYGHIPESQKTSRKQLEPYGWWKNVDFTSDPLSVKWSKFYTDPRYAAEALGAYEGGLTYWTGVWRPTVNSIMRYNVGGFNAPSREAIYYRIHKLAYGASWTYNFEDFVTYDAVNRVNHAAIMMRSHYEVPRDFVPLHPPVVIRQQ